MFCKWCECKPQLTEKAGTKEIASNPLNYTWNLEVERLTKEFWSSSFLQHSKYLYFLFTWKMCFMVYKSILKTSLLISQVVLVFCGPVLNLFYITGLWVQYGQCDDSSFPSGRCLQWCWISNLDVHWYSVVWVRRWVVVFNYFHQNNAKSRSLWMHCFLFSLCIYSTSEWVGWVMCREGAGVGALLSFH